MIGAENLTPSVLVMIVVAVLLTILTVGMAATRVPERDRKGRQTLLFLFVPATVWGWESVTREALKHDVTWIDWHMLDVAAGLFAIAGLVAVFFYWLFK